MSEQKVVYVKPDDIKVPEDRVTSQLDEELLQELRESIKQYGILQPLQLADVNGQLVLVDGLHRLIIAKELGLEKVPAVVKTMTEEELLITNLIMNRQRGKSNPAHEAKILRKLVDEYGMSLRDAASKLGMSIVSAEKYYRIATKCTEKVLKYLEDGLLTVGCAYWLSYISNPEDQNRYADYATKYGYTVEQCKSAAFYAETGTVLESARYVVMPTGEVKPKPIPTYPCGKEVDPKDVVTIQVDKSVWPLVEEAFKRLCEEGVFYEKAEAPAPEVEAKVEEAKEEKREDWFMKLFG